MPDKKPDEPEASDEDEALRKRVDSMMAEEGADSMPAVSIEVDGSATKRKGKKTAPALPKVYKLKEPPKPPIVIKLADDNPTITIPYPDEQESSDTPAVEDAHDSAQLPESEEAQAESDPKPETTPETSTNLNDSATEKAVDDIAAKEGDMLLAVDDARIAKKTNASKAKSSGWKSKLKSLVKNKWTWIVIIILLAATLALPAARYPLLGLVIKKPVTITVLDSKTETPVSSAEVQLAGDSAKTDANGRVSLKAALGNRTLTVTKQYYQSLNSSYFVGFKTATPKSVDLIATGRLVPIIVTNKITGKRLGGAEVKLKGTSSKTDAKGQATVALPTTASSYSAKLSLDGYNTADITITVTDKTLKANNFALTPAGQIYFLSNLGGNIDVVKSNLDGSGRKTVLAGTGKEDPNTTSLLASRDWRFLVLKSRHDSSTQASLYLIDTSSDKVTQFDNSNSDFTLVGWYGHDFIYSLTSNTLSNWQTGHVALKSYDADNSQLSLLDQSQAEGSASSYADQNFYNFFILNGLVVYDTQWDTFTSDGTTYDTTGKADTIRAVQPNGQNKKDYQSFSAGTTGYIQAALYNPQAVYFSVYDNSTNTTSYYDYENQIAKTVAIDNGTFSASYPTFLLSPGGNLTFWTELRDGKNTLFIGNSDAGSKKQIASLSNYSPYGWFGNSYVLVSKSSSELYIMPTSGLASGQQPLKITDYYKPAQTFNGYGYGYGGL